MTVGEEQASKEYLLTRVIDILEEVTRSGPYSVSREWFTLDLTMPQVRVLFLLLQDGTLRMSGLASTLDVSMSSATGLVDRLVEKGLVADGPTRMTDAPCSARSAKMDANWRSDCSRRGDTGGRSG